MNEQAQGWLTVGEVAGALQVTEAAVEKLVAAGGLAAVEVDGALRFHPSAVERSGRRAERRAAVLRWRRRAIAVGALAAVALVCAVTLAASPPRAGEKVPRQIPYRGYLDLNGAPVTDPATLMKFELFTSEGGASSVWSEEQTVSVLDGQFSVALGDLYAIPPNLLAQPSLYLAITVNGQALQGRQRLLTVPYAHYSAGSNAVPAGTVVVFAGPSDPDGWLPCDGRSLNRITYPALFAALGYHYGGSGDVFRLPDYRGAFLRGLDAGAARDPDAGRALGSVQPWATALPRAGLWTGGQSNNHTHPYLDSYWSEMWGNLEPAGMWGHKGDNDTDNKRYATSETTGSNSQDHSHGVAGGDVETRPVNVAVRWVIKAID